MKSSFFSAKRLSPSHRDLGFSLVEVMVASVIAASVLTGAALAFNAIGTNQRKVSTIVSIDIGKSVAKSHYDISGSTVTTYKAPSYGRAARADRIRGRFWDDVSHASAVFCLARDGLNTFRPVYIPLEDGVDARSLDSPESFRLHLSKMMSQSSSVYKSWRGSSSFNNGSIFILQPSGFDDFLAVRAIYDIDIQSTAKPLGTYASVKRYSWNVLTDYYDVFYPADEKSVPFQPLFVFHEKRTRLIHNEGAIDHFKTASDMPFYFIWWPDPASQSLGRLNAINASSLDQSSEFERPNPLPAYADMGGRTNYFFTVPLYPSM
jgi:prepilin-type N-terminal cleavage/methylation domain-containing protein